MELEQKVRAVEEVLQALDQEITAFQSWSTLHCQWGCGRCCFKPDLEASVLEFLPFAFHLYQQDLAMDWLEKLRDTPESAFCVILNPTQGGAGMCSQYAHRGLICRLFGYSARTNKYGSKELVTCQIIKTEQAQAYTEAISGIEKGNNIPVMTNYYMKLHAIDYNLAQEFHPINKSIRRAIETILHYYAYRA